MAPSSARVALLFRTIEPPDGWNVTCLVTAQLTPSDCDGGPNELIVPLPEMTTLFVSTESSGGAIATVVATGNVTAGESPSAHSHGTMPTSHSSQVGCGSTGAASLIGVMVPATASPAITVTSSSVTRWRTPWPRSASAVAVTWAWPTLSPDVRPHLVVSLESVATLTIDASEVLHATGPSTVAGLPPAST